ncbi:hypothetical protein BN6_54960 [Saccharothrix espanaensis DSM 44229]|uniref:Uncharacterized protein n=1 Tax=Saccharothrix espanaensis (strain ATCC 51144 / DSM 44229 / JCM 9112 / NBRC 15066 / NRRL 15764) TaxID=1179773 RepID=K0JXU7_SACES|nr:hypothetical protein BN6_54960 [Saccharothrix espanaensis DSM 44229]
MQSRPGGTGSGDLPLSSTGCRVGPAASVLLRRKLPALTPAELGRLLLRLPALRALSTRDRAVVVRPIAAEPVCVRPWAAGTSRLRLGAW